MSWTVPSPDLAPALPAPPEALVRDTLVLDPPARSELRDVDRDAAGPLVDGLLTRVARGGGALDVAVGEALAALSMGDRLLRLGYSCLGDYARERLGIGETAARNLAKLARELRERPHLREAVRSGEVSARKAQAVLPVARGDDEAAWVERASSETVRALEAAVRASRKGDGDEEPWDRIEVEMAPADRAKLDEAMTLAGRVLGAGAPKWQRLEVLCQEYLAENPREPRDEEDSATVPWGPEGSRLEELKEALEHEMHRWEFLEVVPPVPAPVDDRLDDEHDLERIDARLRELAAMRDRWDVLLGHLAMLMKWVGLWHDAGFVSFAHYCEERLGSSRRNIEQRLALARRLYSLPGLREAMEAGRVSYEKARLVARVADEKTVDAWIRRAETSTCIVLRREIEQGEEAQMCARGELSLRVPRRVRFLLDAAVAAVREREGRWMPAGECLRRVAEHFIATWAEAAPRPRTRHQKVIARDGFCRVPGCSRPAAQAHHLRHRSAGGPDEDANLAGLCPPHHLHGVHRGWIRVSGTAPDALTWEMAAPPVQRR